MTSDFHLFGDPDLPTDIDSDLALVAAYLARELSVVQIAAVQDRLANDRAFREKVQPLIDGWALPGSWGSAGSTMLSEALARREIDAGWKRHLATLDRPRAAGAGTRKRSLARIAAVIALIVLPIVTFAQIASYVAKHRPAYPTSGSPVGDVEGRVPGLLSLAQGIPVVELSAPTAKTPQTLGAVLGLREASDGRVLVNDAGRRQIVLFERSLASFNVVVDSTPGTTQSYGNMPSPLIAYLGDSSLFEDHRTANGGFLVLDGHGAVARAIAFGETYLMWVPSHVDARGHLIYRYRMQDSLASVPREGSRMGPRVVSPTSVGSGSVSGRGGGAAPGRENATAYVVVRPDSAPIHRVDFESRRTDTVGFIMVPPPDKLILVRGQRGAIDSIKQVINPLSTVDEWATLSDGTIAFVRGGDYHVDWIHPDGTKTSSPKLPFEWKAVAASDKQRIVDSTRAALDSLDAISARNTARADSIRLANPGPPANRGRGPAGAPAPCGGRASGATPCPEDLNGTRRNSGFAYEIAPSGLPDYYPPFQRGAVIPDRDGNLWILPRTSSASKRGELVYDVVNPKQGFVRRVRLPLGRSIAGFGKGGVVYLQAGDLKNGFVLERTNVPK